MSEVSQLNEMHSVLIASKEDNHKKRQEEKELTEKIKTFEGRLEEGVAFTNRHRVSKSAATGRMRKRTQALDDLFLKLEHVGRQVSDVYLPSIPIATAGMEDLERVAGQVKLDLKAASERSAELMERLRLYDQRGGSEASSTAMRSKEHELKELEDRVKELGVQCIANDDEASAAEATRTATLEAMQSRRVDQRRLAECLSSATTAREQISLEIAGIATDIDVADRAWDDEQGALAARRDSVVADVHALEMRLAELSDEVADQVRQLVDLEAERERLAGVGVALTAEVGEAERQSQQDCPEVLDLRSQLREKRQRRQILADHLAASEGVVAAHSVHQPEFDTRRAEHQELVTSIASLRSTREDTEGRKGALDDQVRLASAEAAAAIEAVEIEISALKEAGAKLLKEKDEAAAALECARAKLVGAQQKFASVESEAEETRVALKTLSDTQHEAKNHRREQAALHDRLMAQCQAAAKEKRDETQRIILAAENAELEIAAAKERAQQERKAREEAAKQAAIAEALTREVGARTNQMEAAQVEELNRLQNEILSEDARLRTACASSLSGGTEERLQIDITELRAEEALLRSEANAASLRIQRMSGEPDGGDQ